MGSFRRERQALRVEAGLEWCLMDVSNGTYECGVHVVPLGQKLSGRT